MQYINSSTLLVHEHVSPALSKPSRSVHVKRLTHPHAYEMFYQPRNRLSIHVISHPVNLASSHFVTQLTHFIPFL